MSELNSRPQFSLWNLSDLMSGDIGLTDNDKKTLSILKDKRTLYETKGKVLGKTDTNKIIRLEEKKKNKELNNTAKNVVVSRLMKNLGYYPESISHLPYVKKGITNEQEVIDMLMRVFPDFGFLESTEKGESNKYFSGRSDTSTIVDNIEIGGIELDGKIIFDIKNLKGMHGHLNIRLLSPKVNKKYYTQLQGYADLYEADWVILVYVLTSLSPDELDEGVKKISWRYGGPLNADMDPDYHQEVERFIRNNTFDQIPEEKRISLQIFKKNQPFIKKIKTRIENYAWPFYDKLVENWENNANLVNGAIKITDK